MNHSRFRQWQLGWEFARRVPPSLTSKEKTKMANKEKDNNQSGGQSGRGSQQGGQGGQSGRNSGQSGQRGGQSDKGGGQSGKGGGQGGGQSGGNMDDE
ncbi:MAG TPA: hypothetical protein PKC13_20760 [Blastocatellia bacterium]|nr:hypothetical protein [Blastocatellia bacterium]